MAEKSENVGIHIWLLAFGYFLFYIPYSALVKALTSGAIASPGLDSAYTGATKGLVVLPVVLLGTFLTMPLLLWLSGWFRYFQWRQIGPISLPRISSWSVVSGIAFAAIIISTTVSFTFSGVSVVLALLLMRGGVLVMSPLLDFIYSRPVHWYSWAGLSLALLALIFALSNLPDYSITGFVFLNLAIYLTGYAVRLQYITRYAKDVDEKLNRRFFMEEISVAMLVLLLTPLLFANLGIEVLSESLALGYSLIFSSNFPWVGLAIGVFYGFLGIFGSLLYLNRRENTFVVPVNRCSSLLSGVVATYILSALMLGNEANNVQLVSVGIVLSALALMSYFDTRHFAGKDSHDPLQRVFLFVCDESNARSTIAAAICNDEICRTLGLKSKITPQSRIYARSAGLSVLPDQQVASEVHDALTALTVPVPQDETEKINSYGMHRAEMVVCMTEAQRQKLVSRFPWAAGKITCLDENNDIAEPSRLEADVFIQLAAQMQPLVAYRLNKDALGQE